MKNLTIFLKILIFINYLSITEVFTHSEWYTHKTAILSQKNDNVEYLKEEVEKLAKLPQVFGFLNFSKFFDTSKLSDYKWIEKEFKSEKNCTYMKIPLTTEDNSNISLLYFNRGSNKVIVVGPGFTNPAYKMAPMLHIFNKFDVAIINYRGHGNNIPPITQPLNKLTKSIFEVTTETKIGAIEEKDIFAAIKFLKNTKRYKQIVGLGLCYSSLIFLKAQSIHYEKYNESLFDKLILDSPWISLELFCEKLGADPRLICTPQKGGWKNNWLCKNGYFKSFFPLLTKHIAGVDITKTDSVLKHLPNIKIPVLIWYGKNDLTVFKNEFEQIWNDLKNSQKTAIITSNPHVINHIKQKELYALINHLFIEIQDQEKFMNCLDNPNILKNEFLNIHNNDLEQALKKLL